MTTHAVDNDNAHHHADVDNKAIFGFWIYILSDFIVFAALFATYAVLHNNTYGGISIKQITNLPVLLTQSLLFIFSSLTYGMVKAALQNGSIQKMRLWLFVTFCLGLGFVIIEYQGFAQLLHSGNSWQTSAFLSSYFTLVGLHGIHVVVGLLWMIILAIQLGMQGITPMMKTRFACLGMFWDFLNILWIFIFAIVYLMGAI